MEATSVVPEVWISAARAGVLVMPPVMAASPFSADSRNSRWLRKKPMAMGMKVSSRP